MSLNYRSTLRNIPEEPRSDLQRRGSPKLRTAHQLSVTSVLTLSGAAVWSRSAVSAWINAEALGFRVKTRKGKLSSVLVMKVFWGNWSITPLILNLGTRWRWWLALRSGRFTPGTGPVTRWSPEPVWTSRKREKYLTLVGIRTAERATRLQ